MRRILRWLIGRLANLTPGAYYFSSNLAVEINGSLTEWSQRSGVPGRSISTGACALVIACSRNLKPGHTAKIDLEGVEHGGEHVGTYRVTIERLEDEL